MVDDYLYSTLHSAELKLKHFLSEKQIKKREEQKNCTIQVNPFHINQEVAQKKGNMDTLFY